MAVIEVFAPAKINLTLCVTGRQADGWHLLDSAVAFASDTCDRIRVRLARQMSLCISGPMAAGVPADARNLVWRAARLCGQNARIGIEKHLPLSSGIGGGSSDAAATIRALCRLAGQPLPKSPEQLGADVPVCLAGRARHLQGIGQVLAPLALPELYAVLANPRLDMPTPKVFRAFDALRVDAPRAPPPPPPGDAAGLLGWLADQRNDLQAVALVLEPRIEPVLDALAALPGQRLCRMSGSGATCFALFTSRSRAEAGAEALGRHHPQWWVATSRLV